MNYSSKQVRSALLSSLMGVVILISGCSGDQKAADTQSETPAVIDYGTIDQGQASGNGIATLRHGLRIDEEFDPAAMPVTTEADAPRNREYPMQPPTIPHKIGGYEINLNVNKCMSCHGRNRVAESGAKMVSVTHYQDRDHQSLASISATRFFCTQCHVVQTNAKPIVKNDFVDMDKLLK